MTFPNSGLKCGLLLEGQEVKIPVFEYKTHTRSTTEFLTVNSKKFVVLEGIMVLIRFRIA
jgi:uridine kinase